jgi:DNA repair exonuclease SbcCD ATPase subunit
MDDKTKLITFSVRITQENKDKLEHIKDELGSPSFNDVFDNIIERFYSPIKINKENADKIKQLEAQIESLNVNSSELVSSEFEKYKRLVKVYEDMKNEYNELKTENEQLKNQITNCELPIGTMLVNIDPINIKILEYVSDREGKKRKQEWTPDDVINYFIHHRFEVGNLNGGFDSDAIDVSNGIGAIRKNYKVSK